MDKVDVVNDNNEIIKTVSKDLAHAKGLLHRTVIAEMIDEHGNWTLARQASDKQDKGQFVSICGGHVEAGETEEEALRREVQEEVGLENFSHKFVGRIIYNREVLGRKENHYFVVYEIDSTDPIVLNGESVEYKKFTSKELITAMRDKPEEFGPPLRFIINELFRDRLHIKPR
ncbi:MAG: hypothetical protein A2152_03265 [Candidatus Levybacteria bacterium RBG_16_35_6]|nr:MAG: hypothetical protein A2152_03265 [Candidatus Levybacteria bacterium RBG_16_35_6]